MLTYYLVGSGQVECLVEGRTKLEVGAMTLYSKILLMFVFGQLAQIIR